MRSRPWKRIRTTPTRWPRSPSSPRAAATATAAALPKPAAPIPRCGARSARRGASIASAATSSWWCGSSTSSSASRPTRTAAPTSTTRRASCSPTSCLREDEAVRALRARARAAPRRRRHAGHARPHLAGARQLAEDRQEVPRRGQGLDRPPAHDVALPVGGGDLRQVSARRQRREVPEEGARGGAAQRQGVAAPRAHLPRRADAGTSWSRSTSSASRPARPRKSACRPTWRSPSCRTRSWASATRRPSRTRRRSGSIRPTGARCRRSSTGTRSRRTGRRSSASTRTRCGRGRAASPRRRCTCRSACCGGRSSATSKPPTSTGRRCARPSRRTRRCSSSTARSTARAHADAQAARRCSARRRRSSPTPSGALELGVEMAQLAETSAARVEKAIDLWKGVLKQRPGAAPTPSRRSSASTRRPRSGTRCSSCSRSGRGAAEGQTSTSASRGCCEVVAIYRDKLNLDVMVINTYNHILQLKPDHAGALTALAAKYEAMGRWNDLIGVLQRTVDVSTDAKREVAAAAAHRRAVDRQVRQPQPGGQAARRAVRARSRRRRHRRQAARHLRQAALVARAARPRAQGARAAQAARGAAARSLGEMAKLAAERLGDAREAIAIWNRVLEGDARRRRGAGALAGLYEREKRWPALIEISAAAGARQGRRRQDAGGAAREGRHALLREADAPEQGGRGLPGDRRA